MEIEKFDIEGPLLIHLKAFKDNRGFFVERYNKKKFADMGLPVDFSQDNFSCSNFGVLRGLHFQYNPPQGKLVSCTRGEIFDVAVDIRANSPTFGKHISVTLSSESPSAFWIPKGFAHGFCVTSKEGADALYKVDSLWEPSGEACLQWNAEGLSIPWPVSSPVLSSKDLVGLSLDQVKKISYTWNL